MSNVSRHDNEGLLLQLILKRQKKAGPGNSRTGFFVRCIYKTGVNQQGFLASCDILLPKFHRGQISV
jgi:hypothetical protein